MQEQHVVQQRCRLPIELSCRILDLEFVEMANLLPDPWLEVAQTLVVFDTQLTPARYWSRTYLSESRASR